MATYDLDLDGLYRLHMECSPGQEQPINRLSVIENPYDTSSRRLDFVSQDELFEIERRRRSIRRNAIRLLKARRHWQNERAELLQEIRRLRRELWLAQGNIPEYGFDDDSMPWGFSLN